MANLVDIRNGEIFKSNFSGAREKYNAEGNRYFLLFLDDDVAHDLEADGWNIKWLEPRDEDSNPRAFINITLSWRAENKKLHPKVIVVSNSGRKRTPLNEDSIESLDYETIEKVNVQFRRREWTDDMGRTRVKAYLSVLYAEIAEDPFESDYNFDDDVC